MDNEFRKPISDLFYYNKLNKDLEKEVGDYLSRHTQNPKNYSNDIRHQYISAIYARNKGKDTTNLLGRLNEMFNVSNFEPYNRRDKAIDLYNNNLGIQYGLKYPNVQRWDLLRMMLNDYNNNRNNRVQQIGY